MSATSPDVTETPPPTGDVEDGGAPAKAPAKPKPVGAPFKLQPIPPWWCLVNPISWVLWILDFVIWAIWPVNWFKLVKFIIAGNSLRSVQISDADPARRRRTGYIEGGLSQTPYPKTDPDIRTTYELVQRSFRKFADQNCMGTRKFLGWHHKPGVKLPLKMCGEITWQTYAEVGNNVRYAASGLRKLGMEPLDAASSNPQGYEASDKKNTVLIYEETSPQWLTMMMAAHSQSLVVATSYSTLGISSVFEAIKECGVTVMLCNYKDVEKIKAMNADLPDSTLETIVYSTNGLEDKDIPADVEVFKPAPDGEITVLSFEALIKMGKDAEVPAVPPQPDAPAVVMYTSGSTGKPKGVVIQHKSLVATTGGVIKILSDTGVKGLSEGNVTYLAYLPAAHILELIAEFTFIGYGAELGYADPKSIASSGAIRVKPDGSLSSDVMDPLYAPGAIGAFKPTVMAAVPIIWDIMKKGVESKIGGMSPVIKWIMQTAFSARTLALSQGRDTPIFNLLLKKKFKKMTGNRLELALTGGGPCSSDVQTFIRTMFCMPLIQGYALTETTSAGGIQNPADPRDGIVGEPLNSVEIKLQSAPDINDRTGVPYLATDTIHLGDKCLGRGEVCIKGPSVSAGYYKQPEKTAEAWDQDGWFHTGDVGVWTPDGSLKIVDRIKNLIKLIGGEYVAVEAMEAAFNTSVYADGKNGGVMVYADGEMSRSVAFVQANAAELQPWAAGLGMPEADDLDALCASPEACKMVLDDMNAAGKKMDLGSNEKLIAVHLVSGLGDPEKADANSPWTPENNFRTASNKLNRKFMANTFDDLGLLQPLRDKGIRK